MTRVDIARFEACYREHFAFVWRVLRRLGVPDRDLGDATQDVFLVMHRKFAELNLEHSIKSWLYATCLRVASDRRRSAVQRRELLADGFELSLPSTSDAAHDEESHRLEERRALLSAALDAMPIEQRAVFTLFELEGHKAQEIASFLGVPMATVHSRLRLARLVFRRSIERHRAREHFEFRRSGGDR